MRYGLPSLRGGFGAYRSDETTRHSEQALAADAAIARFSDTLFPLSLIAGRPAAEARVDLLLLGNGMKVFAAACMVFLFAFGCGEAEAKAFNFQSQVGVVDVSSTNDMCLTIPNATLAEGNRVQIVSPYKPQALAVAIIQKKMSVSCSKNPDTNPNDSFYSLTVVRGRLEPGSVGIAVIGAKVHFRIANGLAQADLNGDGRKEYFRACTSREGLHLTIWSGKSLRGIRRWHWYYYLRYEVEPSCTNREVR
jgi:hypothetical protein